MRKAVFVIIFISNRLVLVRLKNSLTSRQWPTSSVLASDLRGSSIRQFITPYFVKEFLLLSPSSSLVSVFSSCVGKHNRLLVPAIFRYRSSAYRSTTSVYCNTWFQVLLSRFKCAFLWLDSLFSELYLSAISTQ